jgi:hypothetical protein
MFKTNAEHLHQQNKNGQKGDKEQNKTKMLSHNLFVLQQCLQQNLK